MIFALYVSLQGVHLKLCKLNVLFVTAFILTGRSLLANEC